jgi:phenylalanyl-tRNA synthetase beta chain
MLDPELCKTATARLLKILFECDRDAKVISAFTDEYVKHYETIKLEFDKRYVDRYTGIDISVDKIKTTLLGLGFGVECDGDKFSVTVPSWRATKDVTIKADIIEEITRIYGYDNFDVFTSQSPLLPVRKEILKSDEDRMKDVLVKSYRMHEVHSYIWSDVQKNKELGIETPENVKIINALAPDHKYLRISMIPTLLSFVKENKGYLDSFGVFEIGHTVDGFKENGKCNEEKKLGAVLFSKTENEEALFIKARDTVSELVSDILHKEAVYVSADAKYDFEHPVNTFDVMVGGVKVGYISVPHPVVSSNIDKKCAVAFFEIETEKFANIKADNIKYSEPSKFPAIDIDLTFNADVSAVKFNELTDKLKAEIGELLTDVKTKDIYVAEDGSVALTLRFSFVSKERTLSKQELQPDIEKIIASLKDLGLQMKI